MLKKIAFEITIAGVVQGVGFRPFVAVLAREYDISGWIFNTAGGVTIRAEGLRDNVEIFMDRIRDEAPAGSNIISFEAQEMPAAETTAAESAFIVLKSRETGSAALIPPDRAVCSKCLTEMSDSANRRYAYPFINCTACGPRFTIIQNLPYDRPNTSMKPFPLCASCRAEYNSPENRRFHAEAIGCANCGPALCLTDRRGMELPGDAIENTCELLEGGMVVAIRGIGGFHLACRADRGDVIRKLRTRKGRPHRPLALMVRDFNTAVRISCFNPVERAMLESAEAPVVLVKPLETDLIHPLVDADVPLRGVMLAYTPLHRLLLENGTGILVMTSANATGEPMITDNDEALKSLRDIADAFLLNNREIVQPCDDSVITMPRLPVACAAEDTSSFSAVPVMIRRSRGYAPLPLSLHLSMPPFLAAGADLKSVPSAGRGHLVYPAQHLGDMHSDSGFERYCHMVNVLLESFSIEPELIVHDSHRRYRTRTFALQYAREHRVDTLEIQHHHAHILSVMAENHCSDPVIGLALDGTGYGPDHTIWGGEILVADMKQSVRAAHLKTVTIPGSDSVTGQPWRAAAGYLFRDVPQQLESFVNEMSRDNGRASDCAATVPGGPPHICPLQSSGLELIPAALEKDVNTFVTSSAGRLFDAVAALSGLRYYASYEGQPGIELEKLATAGKGGREYDFDLNCGETIIIDTTPMIRQIISDRSSRADISAAFHRTLISMFVQATGLIAGKTGIKTVALSGGCFANMILLKGIYSRLTFEGFRVLINRKVPANDGNVSLGQAFASAAYRGRVP